jgi:hypothetical protein
MFSVFALWDTIWNSKTMRNVLGGLSALALLLGSIIWLRDDAADEREEEVRDENEKSALKQKLEIKESQDEQIKEADDIRADAEPTDNVPEWMRANRETD